jgi:hypothetical protein
MARRRAAHLIQLSPAQAVKCPRCGQLEPTITTADDNRDST